MADARAEQRELVFCHSCRNDWYKDEHGLQCPQCDSEFVEVIERTHDPRVTDEDGFPDPPSPNLDTLHAHDPWAGEAPDPDEGDIQHVEWNGPGGIHFSRTSYTSSPGMTRSGRGPPNDPFALFQTVTQMMAGSQGLRDGIDRRGGMDRPNGRGMGYGPPSTHSSSGRAPRSPLQEGPSIQPFDGRNTYTATARLYPRDANNAQPRTLPVDDIQGLLGNLLQGIHGTILTSPHDPAGPHANGPALSPFALLQQMFNPASAAHGDAVYTQEALDRVISQLMEQHAGSSAPGPASASAIAALPTKKIQKDMLGSDGKAECSVCMENVTIGDEVTVLPCTHWFHEACIGAWLREHDTCPHCRQGITAKVNADASAANRGSRTPNQTRRNSQGRWSEPSASYFGSQGQGSGTRSSPYRVPETPPNAYPGTYPGAYPGAEGSGEGHARSRPHSERRRSRSSGGGGGGGSHNGRGNHNGHGGGGNSASPGWWSRHFGSGN